MCEADDKFENMFVKAASKLPSDFHLDAWDPPSLETMATRAFVIGYEMGELMACVNSKPWAYIFPFLTDRHVRVGGIGDEMRYFVSGDK